MTTWPRRVGQLPRIRSCAQTPLRHTIGIEASSRTSTASASSDSTGAANSRAAPACPLRPTSSCTAAASGSIRLFTAPVWLASKPLPR